MNGDSLAQVRQAHRICAAWYQHMLPMLNEVAQKMDTKFLLWETWSFNKPSRRQSNPLECWKWDLLPMMDVSFVFSKQQQPGNSMAETDFVMDLKLVTDSELESDYRETQYSKNDEPLAIKLKKSADVAESYLGVYFFSAVNNAVYDTPEELWSSYDGYPETNSLIKRSDNDQIKGIGFSVPLSKLANDNGMTILVQKALKHLDLLLSVNFPLE